MPWSRNSVAASSIDCRSLFKRRFAMPNRNRLPNRLMPNLDSALIRPFLVIDPLRKLMPFIQRLNISQYQLNDQGPVAVRGLKAEGRDVGGLEVAKSLAYSAVMPRGDCCGLGPRNLVERL